MKGSGKMPRGAVHPSDVIRTFMSDLDAVGVYAKGGDVDRWLAAAQRNSVLCVNPLSLSGYSAVLGVNQVLKVNGSVGDHLEPTVPVSVSVSEIHQQPADLGPEHSNSALHRNTDEDGDENEAGDRGSGQVVGVSVGDAPTVDTSALVSSGSDSAGCLPVPSVAMDVIDAVGDAVIPSPSSELQQTSASSSSSCVLQAAATVALIDSTVPHSSSPSLLPSSVESPPAAPVSATVAHTTYTSPLPLPLLLSPPSLPQLPALLQKSIVPTALDNIPRKLLSEQLTEQSDDNDKHTNSRSASAVSGLSYV